MTNEMATAGISALVQVGVVLLLAAMTWLAVRRPEPFRSFVGLTAAPWRVTAAAAIVGILLALIVTSVPAVRALAGGEGTVPGAAAGGLSAGLVVILALKALAQTSLSEELLFRGLIGRNLIHRWGFAAGNLVQACLFGLAHLLVLLIPGVTAGTAILVVIAAGIVGWGLGWANARFAGGSVLPGWAAHGAGNLATFLVLAPA